MTICDTMQGTIHGTVRGTACGTIHGTIRGTIHSTVRGTNARWTEDWTLSSWASQGTKNPKRGWAASPRWTE